MTTTKVTVKYEHDIMEGWACVSYYCDGILIASDDGANTIFHGDSDARDLVYEYWALNGHPDPDWESYDEAIMEASYEQIKNMYGEEWVCLGNRYESYTSNGFANTYYIESSGPGETSKYERFESCQVKDIDDCYIEELVDWAKDSKGYSWF